jgi:hypothetical protein
VDGEDALKERIDGVERMLLALRVADLEAIRVAREDVKERMAGFPAEYAKKSELDGIRETALRLDKTALPVKDYETAHNQLKDEINERLTKAVFEATVREWTVWRQDIDRMRNEALGKTAGGAATWRQIAAVLTIGLSFLALVVLFANSYFH